MGYSTQAQLERWVTYPMRKERGEMTLYEQAHERVVNTPELEPFAEVIFADWPEGDEHYQWIIETPVDEIVEWAESIANDTR
jgi:hypothetical protein